MTEFKKGDTALIIKTNGSNGRYFNGGNKRDHPIMNVITIENVDSEEIIKGNDMWSYHKDELIKLPNKTNEAVINAIEEYNKNKIKKEERIREIMKNIKLGSEVNYGTSHQKYFVTHIDGEVLTLKRGDTSPREVRAEVITLINKNSLIPKGDVLFQPIISYKEKFVSLIDEIDKIKKIALVERVLKISETEIRIETKPLEAKYSNKNYLLGKYFIKLIKVDNDKKTTWKDYIFHIHRGWKYEGEEKKNNPFVSTDGSQLCFGTGQPLANLMKENNNLAKLTELILQILQSNGEHGYIHISTFVEIMDKYEKTQIKEVKLEEI